MQTAAKWSILTELIARVIAPVTQLILARVLAPEAFGVVAIVVMVTSFAEMFSDAGFQKYLIQHEFDDHAQLDQSANVAFWSSFTVALVLLGVIAVFRDSIASLLGNPGLGLVLVVTSLSIPLSTITSTQLALFRRKFEYKKLLPVRVGAAFLTLLVSVPLAIMGFDYWSLIVGLLATALLNAVALTLVSTWKPRLFYSYALLKRMLSFSAWSLLESISIWMTSWSSTFVVSSLLTVQDLGLFRQPMTIVNSVFALVTAAATPILFSALSRLQSEPGVFRQFFYNFQSAVALVVLPVGAVAFLYRDFLTLLLFGEQWVEASLMFGLWSLSTAFMIVFSHFYSEVFRSLGKPRISLYSQLLYMTVMIPVIYYAALQGFNHLVIVISCVRIVAVAINQIFVRHLIDIRFFVALKNILPAFAGVCVMALFVILLDLSSTPNFWYSFVSMAACVPIYLLAICCFRVPRGILLGFAKKVRRSAAS